MNILNIVPIIGEIIETDSLECSTFCRYSKYNWEILMGELWEPCYNNDLLKLLEDAYVKAKK
jgi:hypothetical protein